MLIVVILKYNDKKYLYSLLCYCSLSDHENHYVVNEIFNKLEDLIERRRDIIIEYY